MPTNNMSKFASNLILLAHHHKSNTLTKKKLLSLKSHAEKHSNLLFKTALISGGSCILGDAICQYMLSQEVENIASEAQSSISSERLARMGLIGFVFSGPLNYCVITLLERIFSNSQDFKTVLKKTAVNSLFSPVFIFITLALSEGLKADSTMDDVKQKLKRDYMRTLAAGMCFWPLVSVLNNRFVPASKRAIVSSFVAIFWNIFLSNMANRSTMEQSAGESALRSAKYRMQLEQIQNDITSVGQAVAFGEHDAQPQSTKWNLNMLTTADTTTLPLSTTGNNSHTSSVVDVFHSLSRVPPLQELSSQAALHCSGHHEDDLNIDLFFELP